MQKTISPFFNIIINVKVIDYLNNDNNKKYNLD